MRHKVCDSCLDTTLLRMARQAIGKRWLGRGNTRIDDDASGKLPGSRTEATRLLSPKPVTG